MVGRENKGGAVFSWADEVEKEEEAAAAAGAVFSWADEMEKEEEEAAAAAAAQLQQRQKKPNPFGSARPREVVLQHKGIDWRQLDLHLQQPSPSRKGFQKQSSPQFVALSPHPQVRLSPISCAPPLRYPPKYVAGLLYEHWVSMAMLPNASGTGTGTGTAYQQHGKIGKVNPSSPGRGNNQSTMRTRTGTRSEFVEAREAHQGKILEGKENFHGRNSLGLPLLHQNIGTPEMHGKRMPLSATGIVRQVDPSMDQNDGATEQKWQKVNKKRPDLSIKQQVKSGVHRKRNFEKKWIKLQT